MILVYTICQWDQIFMLSLVLNITVIEVEQKCYNYCTCLREDFDTMFVWMMNVSWVSWCGYIGIGLKSCYHTQCCYHY